MPELDPRSTALVLIDLQKGIVARPLAPRSGAAVVETAIGLAVQFRAVGSPVILVRVAFAADRADMPPRNVDEPLQLPPGGPPPEFSELASGLAQPGDLQIVKRQWGAFHGTELDLQLRRRGIRTLVLGGIATNFGVEATALEAWQHGYDVVLAEDATASVSTELHEMAIRHILPRLSRVSSAADIRLAA